MNPTGAVRPARLLASLALAAGLAAPASAAAYELRTDSTGHPIRWPSGAVALVLRDAPVGAGLPPAKLLRAAEAAAAAWTEAAGGELALRVEAAAGAGEPGYDPAGENASEILFARDAWAYDPDALAVAILTVDVRRHAIVDADVVFNAVDRPFAIVEGEGATAWDFQNTLTHELGHAIGLEHEPRLPEVVMYPGSTPGETRKRRLADDDREGVAFLYLGDIDVADAPEASTGCAAADGGAGLSGLAALLALLGLRRRPAPVPVPIRSRRLPAALALAAALALPGAASAADLLGRPETAADRELVMALAPKGRADAVIHGVVERTRTFVQGRRAFTTESTVRVERCIAGACAVETLRVQQPGGKIGDLEQIVTGSTPLAEGEEVVLVLEVLPGADAFRPVGLDRGLYRVERASGAVRLVNAKNLSALPTVALRRPAGIAAPALPSQASR